MYPIILEHYTFYSSLSQDHDPFSLQFNQFAQWLDDCNLIDDASQFCRRVDYDILFQTVTRPNHALMLEVGDRHGSATAAFRGENETDAAFHLDRALLRFEMMQACVTPPPLRCCRHV